MKKKTLFRFIVSSIVLVFLLLFFPNTTYAKPILEVPLNQKIVSGKDINIKIANLKSCPANYGKKAVLSITAVKGFTTLRPIDFGNNDEMQITQKFDIGSNGQQTMRLQVGCGNEIIDANGFMSNDISNIVTITVLSASEADRIRPKVNVDPNPPYVNEPTVLLGFGLNESGCKDGTSASLEWQDSGDLSHRTGSGPLTIIDSKITFHMGTPFKDTVGKELWVKCAENNIESLPHLFFEPKKRDTNKAPTPIPTPIFPPCIEGLAADGKTTISPVPNANEEQMKAFFGQITKCTKVDSAIGGISTDPKGFILKLFQVLLGLSGGIALLLIIRSGYKYMTSQGNPETTKAAQEEMTSAIVGLLFLIFSMVILQIIGVDLLKIPGLR